MAKGAKAARTILDDNAGGLVGEVSPNILKNGYETVTVTTRDVPTRVRRELTPELYETALKLWREQASVDFLARRLNIDPKTARKAAYGPMPKAWKGKRPLAVVFEAQQRAMVESRIDAEARARKVQLTEIEGRHRDRERVLQDEVKIGAGARRATAGAIALGIDLLPTMQHLARAVLPLVEKELSAGTLKPWVAIKMIRDYIAVITQLTQQNTNLVTARKIGESEPMLDAIQANADALVVTRPEDAAAVIALANRAIERAQRCRDGANAILGVVDVDGEEGVSASAFAVRQGSADERDADAGNADAGREVRVSDFDEPDMADDEDAENVIEESDVDPDAIDAPTMRAEWGASAPAEERERATERRRARGIIAAIRAEAAHDEEGAMS